MSGGSIIIPRIISKTMNPTPKQFIQNSYTSPRLLLILFTLLTYFLKNLLRFTSISNILILYKNLH